MAPMLLSLCLESTLLSFLYSFSMISALHLSLFPFPPCCPCAGSFLSFVLLRPKLFAYSQSSRLCSCCKCIAVGQRCRFIQTFLAMMVFLIRLVDIFIFASYVPVQVMVGVHIVLKMTTLVLKYTW